MQIFLSGSIILQQSHLSLRDKKHNFVAESSGNTVEMIMSASSGNVKRPLSGSFRRKGDAFFHISFKRSSLRIFFSRLETCTCVMPRASAVSVCVRLWK